MVQGCRFHNTGPWRQGHPGTGHEVTLTLQGLQQILQAL